MGSIYRRSVGDKNPIVAFDSFLLITDSNPDGYMTIFSLLLVPAARIVKEMYNGFSLF